MECFVTLFKVYILYNHMNQFCTVVIFLFLISTFSLPVYATPATSTDIPNIDKDQVSAPIMSTISPKTATQGSSKSIIITGKNFLSSAIVNLTKSGNSNMTISLNRITSTRMTGTLNIPSDAEIGTWHVFLQQDGTYSSSNLSFAVSKGTNLPSGNLIGNGDFEHPKIPECAEFIYFEKNDRINEWSVLNGSVDPNKAWKAANGTQSLDLLGWNSGTITQTITTKVGKKYTLSLYYAGNPDNRTYPVKKFQIIWDKKTIDTLSFDTSSYSRTNMGWKFYQRELTAKKTSTDIAFKDVSNIPCINGITLDDIKLIEK